MAATFLLGRLVFGGFFLYNGLNHFISHAMLTHIAASKGVPMADLAVLIAGLLITFGGASIILGWRPELGLVAIVLFLLPVSFLMHNFWAEPNGAARTDDLVNFTKNMALLGGTLMMVAIPQPWPYSISARRRWVV